MGSFPETHRNVSYWKIKELLHLSSSLFQSESKGKSFSFCVEILQMHRSDWKMQTGKIFFNIKSVREEKQGKVADRKLKELVAVLTQINSHDLQFQSARWNKVTCRKLKEGVVLTQMCAHYLQKSPLNPVLKMASHLHSCKKLTNNSRKFASIRELS